MKPIHCPLIGSIIKPIHFPLIGKCFKLISLLFLLSYLSLSQQIITPISLQDDQPKHLKTLSISQRLQDLPTQQQTHENKFIDKHIQISTLQTFTYSSTALGPIFVLDKQWCHSHEGTIEVHKLQDIYYHDSYASKEKHSRDSQPQSIPVNSFSSSSISQQHSWIYNSKYSILYKVSSALTVDAYKINHESLTKKVHSLNSHQQINSILDQQQATVQKAISHIASIELLATQEQKIKFFDECSEEADVLPILSKNLEKLYVFACDAIYMIECQSVLAKVSGLFYFGGGNVKETDNTFMGIEVKTVNEYIFWLSESQGIRIYGIGLDGRLDYIETLKAPQAKQASTHKNSIKKAGKQVPKLSSLQYLNGMLYVLTLSDGIFLYERRSAYHFELMSYLEYLPEIVKVNKEIVVWEEGMLIWSESRKWQFVAEINIKHRGSSGSSLSTVNSQIASVSNSSFSLNRYFKGYKSISQISIFPQKNSHSPTNLLIVSQKGVQLYPLNKDPREISMMMNGVVNSHVGRDLRQLCHIGDGVFVFEAYRETIGEEDGCEGDNAEVDGGVSSVVETYLVTMKTRYPAIECKFQEEGAYTIYVQQQLIPNQTSPSPHLNPTTQSTPTPAFLHYQPTFYHRLSITVRQQLSIEYITILISILSITCLIIIISLLIYWRQNKLTLIDKLVIQIRKLNQNKLRSVEFEESSPHKAVERKWDQLREEIQEQMGYQVEAEAGDDNLVSDRNFINDCQDQQPQTITNFSPVSPSKHYATSKTINALQNCPKFTDPILNQASPPSNHKRQSDNSFSKGPSQNQPIQQARKSLKSDMQISHQDIVIQSPNVDKKIAPFSDEMEQKEFQELQFGADLNESKQQKQVHLSVLDDNTSRDEDQLLDIELQQQFNSYQQDG